MLTVAAGLAAVALVAPTAQASEPASGEVSATHLTQSWTGEAYGEPMNLMEQTKTHALCVQPFCDTFSLTVKDVGHLKVHIDAPGSADFVDVLITKPDGSTERLAGAEGSTSQEVVYENADKGTYMFDVWTNAIAVVFNGTVNGLAELCIDDIGNCFLQPVEEEEEGF